MIVSVGSPYHLPMDAAAQNRETPKNKPGPRGGVAAHPQRRKIEVEIASQVPMTRIAQRYGLSKYAIWRHAAQMPEDLKARLKVTPEPAVMDPEALKRSEGQTLMAHLIAERVRQQRIADRAQTLGDLTMELKASGRVVETLTQVAKILGELPTGHTTINQTFLLSSDWTNIRRAIMGALSPYRDARAAVVDALRQLEAGEMQAIEGAARTVGGVRPALDHLVTV